MLDLEAGVTEDILVRVCPICLDWANERSSRTCNRVVRLKHSYLERISGSVGPHTLQMIIGLSLVLLTGKSYATTAVSTPSAQLKLSTSLLFSFRAISAGLGPKISISMSLTPHALSCLETRRCGFNCLLVNILYLFHLLTAVKV